MGRFGWHGLGRLSENFIVYCCSFIACLPLSYPLVLHMGETTGYWCTWKLTCANGPWVGVMRWGGGFHKLPLLSFSLDFSFLLIISFILVGTWDV
ncbi:hypothetical protein BO94DRAFT_261034 [Aspergillus sclerotioniger CBS 115572]|uniref:Uncharacterized protein n=1 Tax=Aspergillus sclerotioniger CBS 115572 TaxID=1450535 RepID=A0A317VFF6_9EURO|nr:hypothetical protein BO94DRAFT_261034 [Aspergillus sclerotioniger CBS 115572]PWY71602.1 hypothetical protein BO94DRAFT_261034 [Aspergillus sclerotioniger CBS 115572]